MFFYLCTLCTIFHNNNNNNNSDKLMKVTIIQANTMTTMSISSRTPSTRVALTQRTAKRVIR